MTAQPQTSAAGFDPQAVRRDFPALHQEVNGHPLVYLDNAATTQKPEQVIEAIGNYYRRDNANVHRGAHTLSDRATRAFESARERVARFIRSPKTAQVIWTSGTTEAINLVARSWGEANVGAGDEIVLTWMEHHANIVPWQMLAERTGAVIRVAEIDDHGVLDVGHLTSLLGPRTKLLAFTHVSNALGTVLPVVEIVERAHAAGARVLLDAAQSAPRLPLDVRALGCDFLAFSGHKMAGPTGIGVLVAREELLEAMPPFLGGGEMINKVTLESSTWAEIPHKFEAGTPHIAGAIGLAAAIDFVEELGRKQTAEYESARQ